MQGPQPAAVGQQGVQRQVLRHGGFARAKHQCQPVVLARGQLRDPGALEEAVKAVILQARR